MSETIEVLEVKVPVTSEERIAAGRAQNACLRKVKLLQNELKLVTKKLKGQIDEQQSDADRLGDVIDTGEENRSVQCRRVADYEHGKIEWFILGTDHCARSEPMEPDEQSKHRQMTLDLARKRDHENAKLDKAKVGLEALNGGKPVAGLDAHIAAEKGETPAAESPKSACEGCGVVVNAVSNHRGDCLLAPCSACTHPRSEHETHDDAEPCGAVLETNSDGEVIAACDCATFVSEGEKASAAQQAKVDTKPCATCTHALGEHTLDNLACNSNDCSCEIFVEVTEPRGATEETKKRTRRGKKADGAG